MDENISKLPVYRSPDTTSWAKQNYITKHHQPQKSKTQVDHRNKKL